MTYSRILSFSQLCLLVCFLLPWQVFAQSKSDLEVLIVTAHPDDEAMFAAAVYEMIHGLDAKVDLALVTDGSGGYHYSTLAESIYGLKLTDESVAREYLPAIRKRELMNGGQILGLRNYFFLDQLDHRYTLNVDSVLSDVWDVDAVQRRLATILADHDYDFVLTHLPIPSTHGHHKGATIMALTAVEKIPAPQRPLVLGSFISSKSDTSEISFSGVPGYPITHLVSGIDAFSFDRNRPFGRLDRLNYKIIVNWLIAEHKSQGTMQLLMNRGDIENFWIFDTDSPDAVEHTKTLFEQLNNSNSFARPN